MKTTLLRTGLCAAMLAMASASAGTIGTAAIADVTLAGNTAGYLSYGNGINPQSDGRNGGSAGFDADFASLGSGSWTRLAAFDVNADDGFMLASSALGPTLRMTFDRSDTRHGNWSVTNTSSGTNVALDLVFAIHTGGGSGAFLFDNQLLRAGASSSGSWALNLLNDAGNYSGYSNLTVFARDAVLTAAAANTGAGGQLSATAAASKVPEPAPLLLTGLGLLGLMASRRRKPVPARAR